MRLSLGLLVASVAAGLLSVAAALLAMPAASLQFGLVMLLALLGYVLPDRSVRRVRWAVAAGIGFLAVVAAMRLLWYQEQVDEAGGLTSGQGVAKTAMLAGVQEVIDRERVAALGLTLGVLCLAAGVSASPSHGRRRGVATSILALLLVAWLGLRLAGDFGRHPLLDLLGTVWPALLAAFVTVGALALSGWQADRRWLLPLGLFLLSVAAARAYSDLAAAWSAWWIMTAPPDGAFLQPAVMVGTSTGGFPQVSRAIEAAIALAGAGLVAVGALRSSREADAA
ncbi:aminopeptidase [Micromonospora sp. URMC 105]|uniref:aminopeptidase n=1 Tax=Micromonospora sp. URMC 105 TaxID=3423413 RepID=UPI003F1B17AC